MLQVKAFNVYDDYVITLRSMFGQITKVRYSPSFL